jgi:hypothetical protein
MAYGPPALASGEQFSQTYRGLGGQRYERPTVRFRERDEGIRLLCVSSANPMLFPDNSHRFVHAISSDCAISPLLEIRSAKVVGAHPSAARVHPTGYSVYAITMEIEGSQKAFRIELQIRLDSMQCFLGHKK